MLAALGGLEGGFQPWSLEEGGGLSDAGLQTWLISLAVDTPHPPLHLGAQPKLSSITTLKGALPLRAPCVPHWPALEGPPEPANGLVWCTPAAEDCRWGG